MTSSKTQPADLADSFLDWTRVNAKALSIGAAIIVVAAAGYWFYMRSKQIQAGNAERALLQAKQSMAAGNAALAQSDLQKVYTRYASTPAGVEAGVLLSEIDYDAGKFQDGISRLTKVVGTSAASSSEPTIRGLEGDGYAQMGKPGEAAKAYERAAAASVFENERAVLLAKAARAYQTAGDATNAKRIWESMLNDPKAASMAPEARVRLGELTAQVAGR